MASVSLGVNVTSITSAGSVVTVAASGHGLVVGQGFSLQGVTPSSLNVNSTVTGANASGITFNMTNPPSYVSGGKIFPAKEVVILSVSNQSGGINLRYILWLTTTQPVPSSGTVSQWTGASVQESSALTSGTTIEIGKSQFFPSSLSEAQIQAFIASDFSAQQTAISSAIQPGQFYGVYYDGSGWSG